MPTKWTRDLKTLRSISRDYAYGRSTRVSMIKSPFQYFGGKSRCADLVWDSLGNVDHYVEPFFGSGAVLFARPHEPNIETVNDYDGFVANFWRAVQADPCAVADAMNWPVNEVDLESRHRWLCKQPDKNEFLDRMKYEPDFYDVKRAAWWCWGLAQWIGSGWCEGEYFPDNNKDSHGRGVCDGANKLPHLGNKGQGVHRKLPHLGNKGRGVHRKRPHLSDGRGVHRQLPHLGSKGQGETARRGEVLRVWMEQIADRLRNVRVCCGDWSRICTDGATAYGTIVGVFLDPPYSAESNRNASIYRCEDLSVAHTVREWCKMRTDNHRYRIVLAGYEGEHDELESMGWAVESWKANGGMANAAKGDTQGKVNKHRERLWLSPSCCVDSGLFR